MPSTAASGMSIRRTDSDASSLDDMSEGWPSLNTLQGTEQSPHSPQSPNRPHTPAALSELRPSVHSVASSIWNEPNEAPQEAWQITGLPTHPAPLPPDQNRTADPPTPQRLLHEHERKTCQETLAQLDAQRQDLKRSVKAWLDQLERLQRQQLQVVPRRQGSTSLLDCSRVSPSGSISHSNRSSLRAAWKSPKPALKLLQESHNHNGILKRGDSGTRCRDSFIDANAPLRRVSVDKEMPPLRADSPPPTTKVAKTASIASSAADDLPQPSSQERSPSSSRKAGDRQVLFRSASQAIDPVSPGKLFKKSKSMENKTKSYIDESYLSSRPSAHEWKFKRQKSRALAVFSSVAGNHVDEDYAETEYQKRKNTLLWRMSHGITFQATTAVVILINAILIGLHADIDLKAVIEERERPDWFFLEIFFAVFFTAELLLRVMAERLLFIIGHDKLWNILDTILVTLGILDVGMYRMPNITYLRLVRFIRLLRLARVVKAVSSFRIIVYAIVASLTSLFWCFIVVVFIIYMFSVFFLNGVTLHFHDMGSNQGADATSALLKDYYGSVPKTISTLWMSVSGGLDWDVAVEPLRKVHWMYEPLYHLYIFFMCLGVLNVVVGWFVATTSDIAAKDREAFINNEMTRLDQYSRKLRRFFQEADLDRSGVLTYDHFKQHLTDDRVKAYFHALELDVSQASTLFRLLDTDGSNEVNFEEFLSGCMRLKGQARSLDVNMLIYETNRVFRKLEGFFDEWHAFTEPLREDDVSSDEGGNV